MKRSIFALTFIAAGLAASACSGDFNDDELGKKTEDAHDFCGNNGRVA